MTKHDEIANRLAKKLKTKYKSNKGIDLVIKDKVIEVETKKSGIYQGIKQVEKSSKARYLAVNKVNVKNAINATRGTGIGIMGEMGSIVKKASRKK